MTSFVRLFVISLPGALDVHVKLHVVDLVEKLRAHRQTNSAIKERKSKRPRDLINGLSTQRMIMDMHHRTCIPMKQDMYNIYDPDTMNLLWDIKTFASDPNMTNMLLDKIQNGKSHNSANIIYIAANTRPRKTFQKPPQTQTMIDCSDIVFI